MQKLLGIITAILLFFLSKSYACKCGVFSDPNEMYKNADLIFLGKILNSQSKQQEKILKNGVKFKLVSMVKGSTKKIGSESINIDWSMDQNNLCRGFSKEGYYLIFAKDNPTRPFAFLTDCYSEIVQIKDGLYNYKGNNYKEFDAIKVNPNLAGNGVRPLYANQISEIEAKDIAKQHLFADQSFKINHAKEMASWKPKTAKKIIDDRGQPYWEVIISYDKPATIIKEEHYLVSFYNTTKESFVLRPGE